MWQYLFYFFLAYSLYQLVFKFIIPIYRTTRQVKKGFRDMQDRMNGQMGAQQPQKDYVQQQQPAKNNVGDYIDFEEVKD